MTAERLLLESLTTGGKEDLQEVARSIEFLNRFINVAGLQFSVEETKPGGGLKISLKDLKDNSLSSKIFSTGFEVRIENSSTSSEIWSYRSKKPFGGFGQTWIQDTKGETVLLDPVLHVHQVGESPETELLFGILAIVHKESFGSS